jgi:hypothetical protein
MNVLRLSNLVGSLGALACALTLSACADAGSVSGLIDVELRSETLLAGDLLSVNGTYGAGCTDRTGAWSVLIDPLADMDNAVLSVVLNDTGCVLTLTEINTTLETLTADPPIALTASFKGTPSAFDDPVQFYGNVKFDSIAYDDDFTLTFLYSDDPNNATDENTASFQVKQSSAEGDEVSVPDYGFDPSLLVLVTDAADVVQTATGTAALSAGMVTGTNYVVVSGGGLSTYEELDTAYLGGGAPTAVAATIAASKFDLVGDTLPEVRTVIIARIENGVNSYQSFEVTFNAAG